MTSLRPRPDHAPARGALAALALVLPTLLALPPAAHGSAAADLPCDLPAADLPCNLRMTFAPNRGNENYITINPANPDNIVATSKDYGLTGSPGVLPCNSLNVWTGYYATLDGGRTWTNGFAPGHPGSPPNAITKYRCSTDPIVAADNAGTIYLSGLAYDSTSATDAVWVAKSTDGGLTYSDLGIADEQNFNDKNWLAVDPETSHVYVTWTKFNGNNGIYIRRALNGDVHAWDGRIKLCSASCGSAQGSYPVVGPDGEVHVLWSDNISGGTATLYLATSADFGATFTAEDPLFAINGANWNGDAEYRTPTLPQLAADRSAGATRGNLYVVWQDKRNGDPDAYFSASVDGGSTWSAPLRLNDDPIGNGKGQVFPAIAVDPSNGWIHAAWYDRRDDPGNRLFATYYALSKDGGSSWSPNQRVTPHRSDPSPCKHQDGATFIGDYLGIAALDGKARPAMVDTRNGRCDLFTALLFARPRLDVEIGEQLNVSVSEAIVLDVEAFTPLTDAELELTLPDSWTIDDAGGGTLAPGTETTTLRWALGALTDRRQIEVRVTPTSATAFDVTAALEWNLAVEDVPSSGSEAFARRVLVSYPVIGFDVAAPQSVQRATPFAVTYTLANTGYGDATDATVTLAHPAEATPLPKGVAVTVEPPAAGLAYGSPLRSEPQLQPDGSLRWTFPSVPARSSVAVTVHFQAPLQMPLTLAFTASFAGTAPDGQALAASKAAAVLVRGTNTGQLPGVVPVVMDYLTGP